MIPCRGISRVWGMRLSGPLEWKLARVRAPGPAGDLGIRSDIRDEISTVNPDEALSLLIAPACPFLGRRGFMRQASPTTQIRLHDAPNRDGE